MSSGRRRGVFCHAQMRIPHESLDDGPAPVLSDVPVSSRRARVGVASGFALLALMMPVCAAAKGALTVQVHVPRHHGGGHPLTSINVIDGSTTEVLAAGVGTRLRVPHIAPFVGFVAGFSLDRVSAWEDVTTVFRHDRKRTRLTLRSMAATAGGVVAMGDIPVSLPGQQDGNAAGAVLGPLFRDLEPDGARWVDDTSPFKQARDREFELQDEGNTDPSTRLTDNPLTPDLRVDGDLVEGNDRVTGEIRLTDVATGETVHIPVDEPLGPDGLAPVVRKIVDQLAPDIRDRLRRRATTTTTTTTTSVSSTTEETTTTASTAAPSTVGASTSVTTTTATSVTTSTAPSGCTSSDQCGASGCCVSGVCCDVTAHPTCAAQVFSCCGPLAIHASVCGHSPTDACPSASCAGPPYTLWVCSACLDDGKPVEWFQTSTPGGAMTLR